MSRDSPSPTDNPTSRLTLENTDRRPPSSLRRLDIRPRRSAPRTVRPSTDGPKAARKRGASAETAAPAATSSTTAVFLRQLRRRRPDCWGVAVDAASWTQRRGRNNSDERQETVCRSEAVGRMSQDQGPILPAVLLDETDSNLLHHNASLQHTATSLLHAKSINRSFNPSINQSINISISQREFLKYARKLYFWRQY